MSEVSILSTKTTYPIVDIELDDSDVALTCSKCGHKNSWTMASKISDFLGNLRLNIDFFNTETINSITKILPNATAGTKYEFTFFLDKSISISSVKTDPLLGLTFNHLTKKLEGIPKMGGDFKIIFEFTLNLKKKVFTKELKLFINPDPKSLWLNNPSDRKDPFWKPDSECSSENFGFKNLIAASNRGRSHAHVGSFRDDDYGYFYDTVSKWGIIVVADGAGSAKFSRRGSEIVCKAVINYFKKNNMANLLDFDISANKFWYACSDQKNLTNLADHALHAANEALDKIIAEVAKPEVIAFKNDFATTLLFSLVKKIKNKYVVVSFSVGDGVIGLYSIKQKKVEILNKIDSGSAAGETRFLTTSGIFDTDRVNVTLVDDFTSLVLMTDGVSDAKFGADVDIHKVEKWDELASDLNGNNPDKCAVSFFLSARIASAKLLSWLDFWSPGNHDDRTIAILY